MPSKRSTPRDLPAAPHGSCRESRRFSAVVAGCLVLFGGLAAGCPDEPKGPVDVRSLPSSDGTPAPAADRADATAGSLHRGAGMAASASSGDMTDVALEADPQAVFDNVKRRANRASQRTGERLNAVGD